MESAKGLSSLFYSCEGDPANNADQKRESEGLYNRRNSSIRPKRVRPRVNLLRNGHPSGGSFRLSMGLGRTFRFARFTGKQYYRAQSGISSQRPAVFRRDISEGFVPASYKIDKARRFVVSTGTGFLSKEDVLGHMDRISADPDFDPTFSQLLDFTKVTEVGFGPDDVRQFAERNIFSSSSRRAFVVQNDLHFGLARMFEIHRELRGETGIAVFRSIEEAMNWIAVGNLAS